jgi:exopolysaccharide production protein ExoZ
MERPLRLNIRYKSIQALRAFAAIYVTLYHTQYWWDQHADATRGLFRYGNAGVDLFFAISGFVIFLTVRESVNGVYPFLLFLKRRLIRIYPVFWLYAFLFLALGWVDYQYRGIVPFLQSLFFLPGHKGILIISWTLQYEVYFYLLAALCVLDKKFRWLAVAVACIAAVQVLINLVAPQFNFIPASGLYNQFVLEFFIGGAATFAIGKMKRGYATALAIAGAVFFFLPHSNTLGSVINFGLPSALIIIGLTNLEFAGKLFVPRWMVVLGDASYSLYILHILISVMLPGRAEGEVVSKPVILLSVLAVVGISVVAYFVVEKPLLKFLNKYLFPSLRSPGKLEKNLLAP